MSVRGYHGSGEAGGYHQDAADAIIHLQIRAREQREREEREEEDRVRYEAERERRRRANEVRALEERIEELERVDKKKKR